MRSTHQRTRPAQSPAPDSMHHEPASPHSGATWEGDMSVRTALRAPVQPRGTVRLPPVAHRNLRSWALGRQRRTRHVVRPWKQVGRTGPTAETETEAGAGAGAGQWLFALGSRIATHSTYPVIGRASESRCLEAAPQKSATAPSPRSQSAAPSPDDHAYCLYGRGTLITMVRRCKGPAWERLAAWFRRSTRSVSCSSFRGRAVRVPHVRGGRLPPRGALPHRRLQPPVRARMPRPVLPELKA